MTDLLPLNPDFPRLNDIFEYPKIGDTSVPSRSRDISSETLNGIYTYLHPQSPYQYDPDLLERLKLLLDTRFNEYTSGTGLGDMIGCFEASYSYMLLKHHSPGSLTPEEISAWESALIAFTEDQLENFTRIYDDHSIANQWLNGDVRMAMAVYFTGAITSNFTYQQKAADAINLFLTECISSDGAIHKSGYQNSASGYRTWNVMWMVWWWKITGSPEVEAMLWKTIPWGPLTVEPSGFAMQSTANAAKHMYNGLHGRSASLALSYIFGDGYNYTIGQEKEQVFDKEMSLILAVLYNENTTPLELPSNFILYDRAVMGPRIRTPQWATVATARNPQIAAPEEHPDEGLEGKQVGKNTFVGAAVLGPWENDTSLKAALDGVAVEFKQKPGTSTDWGRDSSQKIYRFLSQDEQSNTITRKNFGTIAASYRLSERTTGNATPSWGAGSEWLGEQVWLLTPERLIGLVQIHNDADSEVYGLDTRLVLVGGRYPIMGAYQEVIEEPQDVFTFGDIKVRVPVTTFTGHRSIDRVYTHGSNPDDDYTALVRLHDAADNGDDSIIHYPAGTRRWAIVECAHKDTEFANSTINVLDDSSIFAVLQIRESNRTFRIIQNLTNSTRTYQGKVWGVSGGTATVHKSWTTEVDDITPAEGSPAVVSITLPPYSHAIAVSSTDVDDHTNDTLYYEDVFTEGVIPQTPLGASAAQLPGTLEAEDYDLGGSGVAYYDTSPGNYGTYGSDDVDMNATLDVDGGYNIGWIRESEWLEYTVNIPDGTYNVVARVASARASGSFDLKLGDAVSDDNFETIGTFTIPFTGGWQNWTDVTLENVSVSNGGFRKILRADMTGSRFNINWIQFIPVE